MFSEQRTFWEKEMLIREAAENAREGFFVQLRNGSRVYIPADAPTIDMIIFGMEKVMRNPQQYRQDRSTFIDFLYYWHERLFNRMRKRQVQ